MFSFSPLAKSEAPMALNVARVTWEGLTTSCIELSLRAFVNQYGDRTEELNHNGILFILAR